MDRYERVVDELPSYTGVEGYGAQTLEHTSGGSFVND